MERRRARRYTVWFPMQIDGGRSSDRLAVSQNVSATGVLVATAARLEVGERASLTFQMTRQDPKERIVRGRIARVERNQDDEDGMWPYFVAVQFDSPAPDLQPLLQQIAGGGEPGAEDEPDGGSEPEGKPPGDRG
ncbi:MAG: PilZ domain-containing protein [Deltaproteobacteria bacterium]|nr:PilZ domain-containing protein [Deltaproteobacteria bacterium]